MLLRRCAILWLEPRELARFELGGLLQGGTGVQSWLQWFAHAPHLEDPVEVDSVDAQFLGGVSPKCWVEAGPLRKRHGRARMRRLLDAGLLIARGKAYAENLRRDEQLRAQYWHGLAAVGHAGSRWQGRDSVRELQEEELDTPGRLRERMGAPPPLQAEHGAAVARVSLPRVAHVDFDRLLDARASCRNFDTASLLPLDQFAQLLERVFGARGQVHAADDFDVLKKTSPSGGALHPTEAWLIVQRVEGMAPGLYHYRPLDHALQRLSWDGGRDELDALARQAVAGQHYFSDAHVLVALAPRFARNFWKYRNHAKAYRVCILDVGHLSQTLFLSATEQGLGAFVTAAINEVDIERAFGLTGFADGPLAVCGFGVRASRMATPELDPNRAVWK